MEMRAIVAVVATGVLLTTGFGSMAAACEGKDCSKDAAVSSQKAPLAQTKCPVEGGKINKKLFADHEGKRVYFCCGGCAPEFKKDPAKYIKKLEDQGIVLEKTPDKDKAEGKEATKAESKETEKATDQRCERKGDGCCP